MTFAEAQAYVLGQARNRGVAAEVLGQRQRELTAKAHEGRLEQITQAVQGGLGVRVLVEGRVGYSYTEELTTEALDWILGEAIDNATLKTKQAEFLPPGRSAGNHDLVGSAFDAPLEAKVQAVLGFEATVREDKRVKHVLQTAYTERESEVNVGSTLGADGAYRRGAVGLMGSFVMQEGTSIKQSSDSVWMRDIQMLDPGRTALEFTERTGRLLGARPLRTGRYRAFFEPKAFTGLMGAFWPLWSGKAVMEGKSRLARRIGKSIASSLVTLVDDPTLADGLGARPFDAEGTPARPLVLVDGGVLMSFLHNSETARTLKMENTGHAARSYRGAMGVGPSNLYLRTGSGTSRANGVLVTEVMGVHAGARSVTGEFSVQAFGLWVEDGETAHPVENFAVAGDFLTLLETVAGLGTEIQWNPMMGSAFLGAPMVEVEELSFAGS